jgi:hypothetical protein
MKQERRRDSFEEENWAMRVHRGQVDVQGHLQSALELAATAEAYVTPVNTLGTGEPRTVIAFLGRFGGLPFQTAIFRSSGQMSQKAAKTYSFRLN